MAAAGLTTGQRGYGWDYQRLRPIVFERDGHRCQVRLPGCTVEARHVDHIVPGGPNELDNLRAACVSCNMARRRRRPRRRGAPASALASSSARW